MSLSSDLENFGQLVSVEEYMLSGSGKSAQSSPLIIPELWNLGHYVVCQYVL